jgi:hypothetical protein
MIHMSLLTVIRSGYLSLDCLKLYKIIIWLCVRVLLCYCTTVDNTVKSQRLQYNLTAKHEEYFANR